MAEFANGVKALIGRMHTNPEEFFGEAPKWKFMFNSNFREVLTEPEKGAIHEALGEVRRKEFDHKVMSELLKDELDYKTKVGYIPAPMAREGEAITYAGFSSKTEHEADSVQLSLKGWK